MSLERIFVPTDFSECADHALAFSIQIARKTGASMVIAHINHVLAGGDTRFIIDAQTFRLREKEIQQAMEVLRAQFSELSEIDHKFVHDTDISVDRIRDLAEKEKADLIIMGTKGRGKSIEGFFGSITSGIVRRSTCPIIAVPENAYIKSIRHILLATDFDESNHTKSIETLAALAKALEAEIHIVRVIKNEKPSEITIDPVMLTEWAKTMNGIEHHYHFVSHDDIEKAIMRYAYENGIELLALLGKTHNMLDRLFHKSLSKKLVYHSKLPLLVLPQ